MEQECKQRCVSAGMALLREHDAYRADRKTPIIYPVNLKHLVTEDELKVPHSELAMHLEAAGKDIIAFFLTPHSAHVAYDDGKGCCQYAFGLDTEMLNVRLISKVQTIYGYTTQ